MVLKNFGKSALAIILTLPILLHPQPGLASQTPALASSASLSPGDIGWKAGFSTNGLDNSAEAIATDGKNVYVAGRFSVAGDAVVHGVAMWDGLAWHPLGKEVFNTYYALAVDGKGHLYAAGKFSQNYVNSNTSFARWNGQAWEPLGEMLNGIINALAVDSSGNVYAGGQFSSINGLEASGIAMWDGVQWHSLPPPSAFLYYPYSLVNVQLSLINLQSPTYPPSFGTASEKRIIMMF